MSNTDLFLKDQSHFIVKNDGHVHSDRQQPPFFQFLHSLLHHLLLQSVSSATVVATYQHNGFPLQQALHAWRSTKKGHQLHFKIYS